MKAIEFLSYSYHIFIANSYFGKWGPVRVCFFFLLRLKRIFAKGILWPEDATSKDMYVSTFKELFIHFFLWMNNLSVF